MTKDQVIAMAQEAGFSKDMCEAWIISFEHLFTLVRNAALEESRADVERLKDALECERAIQKTRTALYEDLLNCIAKKYPGETRHDTAKRYLIDREKFSIGEQAQKETDRD